jgi:hypothetical protein
VGQPFNRSSPEASGIQPQRLAAILTGVFGPAGLLLAAVGLYGIIGYSVTRRAREIGIRIAPGTRADHVLRLVMRQGLALVARGSGRRCVICADARTHGPAVWRATR